MKGDDYLNIPATTSLRISKDTKPGFGAWTMIKQYTSSDEMLKQQIKKQDTNSKTYYFYPEFCRMR